MLIDNSSAIEFRTCPLKYYYTRLAEGTGLEVKPKLTETTSLALGSRVHELLEEYYNELRGQPRGVYPASPNEGLENEAQLIMSAYRAKYPVEDFEILDVERSFKIGLPELCPDCYSSDTVPYPGDRDRVCQDCGKRFNRREHIYTGKIDLLYRRNGILGIMDHKTEKRRSSSNNPKKWAARDQASLYLWAARHLFGEDIIEFSVNVLTRPSEKLQEGPVFPERQRLERTREQIDIAIRDLVYTADQILKCQNTFGDNLWPTNKENCMSGWGECEYYFPDTYGWSEDIREQKYQKKTEYLHLEGVPIIQP